ncbi:MAG: amino acid--tRNA ligase-related protein, partial [Dehalococcoidales bacterium]|nr:amino acid--tRNA ligase-related protein [Dehalococcoidales bacterium]
PDIRFGMEIRDISDIAAQTQFQVFKSAVAAGGKVRGISAPGCATYTRSQLDDLNKMVQALGAGGLVTIALDTSAGSLDNLTMERIKSNVGKFLTIDQIKEMARKLEAKAGDLLLVVAGDNKMASTVLGELRREMGKRLKLADSNTLAFAFIVDFPLLERDKKTGRLQAVHHPFTMPRAEDMALLDTEPEKVRARCYDFVCNGYELSSGSIRIHTAELQRRIFRMLGYNDAEINERFGHLLEAFEFGAPPHGGIAPGIDRTIMLLIGEENIREVVAFPKNQQAADLTFNAPAEVTKEQLDELHIRLQEE